MERVLMLILLAPAGEYLAQWNKEGRVAADPPSLTVLFIWGHAGAGLLGNDWCTALGLC